MKYCEINITKLKKFKMPREATIDRWKNVGLIDGLNLYSKGEIEAFRTKIRKILRSHS